MYLYIYSTFDLKYFLNITGDNDKIDNADNIIVD